jgi:hypothetical protein
MSYIHDQKPESNSDDFFERKISSYTDEEALERGVLVAFQGPGGINRVTRAVFTHYVEELGPGVTDITGLIAAMEYVLKLEAGCRVAHCALRRHISLPWTERSRGLTLMFPEDY